MKSGTVRTIYLIMYIVHNEKLTSFNLLPFFGTNHNLIQGYVLMTDDEASLDALLL